MFLYRVRARMPLNAQ